VEQLFCTPTNSSQSDTLQVKSPILVNHPIKPTPSFPLINSHLAINTNVIKNSGFTFEDEAPIDTILGVEIFPVVHMRTKEIIYVSLEDIKE